MSATWTDGKVTLTIEQEQAEVTSSDPYEADPDWTYTDEAGHSHDAKLTGCEWVVLRTWWCETCRDEHDDTELRCKLCGEHIEPGRRYVGHTRYVPGLKSGTLQLTDNSGTLEYLLRPDEMEQIPMPKGTGWDEWLAQVQQRGADRIIMLFHSPEWPS